MNDLFNAALKQLSAKNCSKYELKCILEKDFSSLPNIDDLIEQTIARLEELHLINDSFIANSQAQRYQHKGNRFIVQKLQQKGLDKESIDNTIESLPSEYERALPKARKKLQTLQNLEPKAKENKLLKFLSNRGFGAGTCYQVIDELKGELVS